MVLGGEGRGGNNGNGLDSTEIFSYRDNVWNTIAEKLPDRIRGVRATTINNRILIFGNYELFLYCYFNSYSGGGSWQGPEFLAMKHIMEYNQEKEKWTKIGEMTEGRRWHAVSVIDFAGYEKHCLEV